MSTKPVQSAADIAADARHVIAMAKRRRMSDKEFGKRVAKGRALATFEHQIEQLETGAGARGPRLHAKVAAGSHVAAARAQAHEVVENVRDDAKVFFEKTQTCSARSRWAWR